MNANDSLIIRRCGNGFIVTPLSQREQLGDIGEMMVFQELQYDAEGMQHSDGCLFWFLLKHFSEK